MLTDLSLLDYLHDAGVNSVVWDCSDTRTRRLRLTVSVDHDAGYAAWAGCLLTITMTDVVIYRMFGLGYQIGVLAFEAFQDGISTELEEECSRLRGLGIAIPSLMFTIVFNDGSTLELVCGEVTVEEPPV